MSGWNAVFTIFCIAIAALVSWFEFSSRQPGLAYTDMGLFAMIIAVNLLITRKRR